MYAHDRTMLAKLGFADADKSDARHDLACQYLSTPDSVRRIVGLLGIVTAPAEWRWTDGTTEETAIESRRFTRYNVSREYPLVKGADQYRTSIGFVDLRYELEIVTHRTRRAERKLNPCTGTWGRAQKLPDSDLSESVKVGVEVKISPVGVGDLIRQVKLYQTYTGDWGWGISRWNRETIHWIAATAYPVSALDVQSLRNERILHLLLGRGFHEFIDAQGQASAADNVEI